MHFNALGLILNIIGVILLWKFGLPENINRDGLSLLALEGTDEKEKQKAKRYDKYSNFAILLIVLGFLLQLISNYL